MEPKGKRLGRITAFLGYEPDTERFDAPRLIERILSATGFRASRLAGEIGVHEDTLANLRIGRYQPARRTYDKLARFAAKLDSRPDS